MPDPSRMNERAVGVCSWSLRTKSPTELVDALREVGVRNVQLALDPLRAGEWDEHDTAHIFREAGIEIVSGMMRTAGEDYTTLESIRLTGGVRPDEHWEANRAAASENARLARRLGVSLVTFHAGFIPHEPDDPDRRLMLDRLREVIDRFADEGVRVGFETGQETADTLLDALAELERPAAGVNFDPANMLLYGMGDPIDALRRLAPRVVQLHIKDALPSATPGEWGCETPVGDGAVDWPAFFDVCESEKLDCPRMIEREGGPGRAADMRRARDLLVERGWGRA